MINSSENHSLVSVIMPVYNGEQYLKEAIESILSQSYVNFEFIIINDGSQDNTEEIILSYDDPRIIYIKNSENFKLIKSLNIGFSKAKGKYIARMDADDISLPMRLEKQVIYLEKNPDVGVLGTGVFLKSEKETSELLYHTDDKSLRFALALYCPFIHPSVVLRKAVLDQLPIIFDGNYIHAEDYELWTRLAQLCKLENLPEFLLEYRIHSGQISFLHTQRQIEIAREIRKKYLGGIIDNPTDFSFVFNFDEHKKSITSKLNEISKLYRLNQKRAFFGGDNLEKHLLNRWKTLFLESETLPFVTFFYFNFNTITWKNTWSFKQALSIFRKMWHNGYF